ncbi:MAG: NAD(P)/FAD-dependent oxidoreductase, partial [Alphaproteobacteria bacterium]
VVAGGGDAALQEALHLADYAGRITLITRGEALRARQSYVARAEANPRFTFRRSTNLLEIMGSDSVEGVRLAPSGGGDAEELDCSGVFVFIGIEPNVSYLTSDIERDAGGYVVTDTNYRTSVAGIYAVGAVRAGYSGQLASAVDEAISAIAGLSIP